MKISNKLAKKQAIKDMKSDNLKYIDLINYKPQLIINNSITILNIDILNNINTNIHFIDTDIKLEDVLFNVKFINAHLKHIEIIKKHKKYDNYELDCKKHNIVPISIDKYWFIKRYYLYIKINTELITQPKLTKDGYLI